MNIFSPRRKRSTRSESSCIPFNLLNFNPSPPHAWPLSPHSSPATLPWTFPHSPLLTTPPFSSPSWGASSPLPCNEWGNSGYPPSPFSPATPQVPWVTVLPAQPWYSPTPVCPGYSQYQTLPTWDISTPPHSAFPPHDSHETSAFMDLKSAGPEHIEKIRIYVESPALSHWTKQWGYATAYKRGGKTITLLDVLEAIYNYFQEPLSVDVLPPQYQGMLTAAYTERVSMTGEAYSGLCRVDMLNGYRVLSSMRPLSYGDAAGTMYIALNLRKA
ncbi:hypothetical protein C8R44DRAFT_875188 [Mycena epipterygia]|nr:hypothetical protein C8R44DRAFT_875188 [Mycena epipterygia]